MGTRYVQHRTPPYTTVRSAPYTSVHHHTPSHTFTGNHWFHAVATMFKCCIVLAVHGHHYVHVFGDQNLRTIHLYKKDGLTHYDALLPESPDDADDDADRSGEWNCARFPPPLLRCTLTRNQMKTTLNSLAIQSCCHTPQRKLGSLCRRMWGRERRRIGRGFAQFSS